MRAGVPSEVCDDLHRESREHGQRYTKPWNPVDQIATRELVEYEAAVVGKKVRRQPHPVCLCEHGHAEGVAENVGAVVNEKKHEDRKTTGRGVWNIAKELWVRAAPLFAGVEVKVNSGDCERGGDAREANRSDRQRGPVAAVEEEDRLREPAWDRLERQLGALADDHLSEWVEGSTMDSLITTCDADGVDRRLQQREHDGELPPNHTPSTVRGLKDDNDRLSREVHDDHGEQ